MSTGQKHNRQNFEHNRPRPTLDHHIFHVLHKYCMLCTNACLGYGYAVHCCMTWVLPLCALLLHIIITYCTLLYVYVMGHVVLCACMLYCCMLCAMGTATSYIACNIITTDTLLYSSSRHDYFELLCTTPLHDNKLIMKLLMIELLL